KPLILGWMTLAPPTALLLITSNTVNSMVAAVRGKESGEAIPGYECVRFVQYPDRNKQSRNVTFYNSPTFPLAMFTMFAAGIPAGISPWIYFHTGIDALLGYPSPDPHFRVEFLIIWLYLTSLSWCLSSLFFR